MGARLQRGRSYARSGQVLDFNVKPGKVTGHVQGSRATPYSVAIALQALDPTDWERVEAAMAGRAGLLALLLAGEMPHEIEEAFVASRMALFPARRSDLTCTCSCPDWGDPCKHVAAVLLILAEAFDRDPFLILMWRGRGRNELLENLGRHHGATGEAPRADTSDGWPPAAASPALIEGLDSFWDTSASLAHIEFAPPFAVMPDALLRQLESTAVLDGETLAARLAPAYRAMSEAAGRRLGGTGRRNPSAVTGSARSDANAGTRRSPRT